MLIGPKNLHFARSANVRSGREGASHPGRGPTAIDGRGGKVVKVRPKKSFLLKLFYMFFNFHKVLARLLSLCLHATNVKEEFKRVKANSCYC